jgi:hypothetical protein
MRSIDNLREYVLTAPSICSTTRAILVGYIDGIEHEVGDMVPLPVDADGVPIHVGDVMEADNGTTFEVEHISLYQWGWRCVGEGTDRSGVTCTAHAIPDGCRHHHAPTVEDVLREFAHVGIRIAAKHGIKAGEIDFYADEDAIAEYAARLRLAGEDA